MKKILYIVLIQIALLCNDCSGLELFDDCLCLESINHSLQSPDHINTTTQALFEITHSGKTLSPHTSTELQRLLKNATLQGKTIAIVGAGKSQGGQTFSTQAGAYRVSLDNMNKLLTIDTRKKTVTVEAGMTWKQLQEYIAPHGLAVKAMQSYNDFSIGGSVSVNVHGQDPSVGQIISTIISMQVLMPSGEIITASRVKNKQLFGAIIGGYGLIGIILSVTLQLTNDVLLERHTQTIPTSSLVEYFNSHIINNHDIEFYSARFSVGASDFMKKALVITYKKLTRQTDAAIPLVPTQQSSIVRLGLKLTGAIPYAKTLRLYFEQFMHKRPHITSRNNFLNDSILKLPQNTGSVEYILQEYFLPYGKVDHFIEGFSQLVQEYSINVLNVTARHVRYDTQSLLSFAPRENMCAFVVYIKLPRTESAHQTITKWTRKVIDRVIEDQGTYYLPYHLLATHDQFTTVYPEWDRFVNIKQQYDPQGILSNALYEHYFLNQL